MKNIWRLLKLIPNYIPRLIAVLVITSILGLASATTPYFYKLVVDQVVKSLGSHNTAANAHRIVVLILILAVLRLVIAIFNYLTERMTDYLFIDTLTGVRRYTFAHLVELSIDYYEQARVGEIIQRLQNGVADVSRWLYTIIENSLVNILTVLFILVFLWVKIPVAALIMTIMIPINLYISIERVRRTKQIREGWLKLGEAASGELTETITHISTVRSFSQENYKLTRYFSHVDKFRLERIKQYRVEWSANFLRDVLSAASMLASVGIVAVGAIRGHYTVGDILLVSLYVSQIIGNIGPLGRVISDTGDVESSAGRITELLDIKPTLTDVPEARDLDRLESIEFVNVTFSYPGKRRKVMDNVSFELQQGQSLALVGPSGVGKTTITKLLLRYYAPISGQILINGEDISTFTQNSIRSHIGMVMQEVALFNDTIEENIKFARPRASGTDVKEASEQAHADVFIDKLPEKYKTLVGERGVKLSGGEKQRVAIARAILRQPNLIILDEATSALDSESERYVQDGLHKLMANKTAVIIAHRLSTIRQADLILVLKDGKVLERGNHNGLLQKDGYYAKMYAMQSGGAKHPAV